MRAAYAIAFAAVAALAARSDLARRRPDQDGRLGHVRAAVASAWLVPWYALWLLPLAALAADRRLELATAALCAWMLVIAVPL